MEEIVLVSGARTAIGRMGGALQNTSASDLAAVVFKAALERAGLRPDQIDQVILGCAGQVMEDAYVARHAAVKAGIPIEVPAYNVSRLCGTGLEAIHTAARWIETGDAEIVLAGGTENMTCCPSTSAAVATATAWATACWRTASSRCSATRSVARTWASRRRTWPTSTASRVRTRTSCRCAAIRTPSPPFSPAGSRSRSCPSK